MTTVESPDHLDVLVIGAGFAGIYAVYQAVRRGYSVIGLEAGDGPGGTWYWNRYPGARCDVESLDYSFSFDPQLQEDWRWSERYATQPEILSYIEHVADRYEIREKFHFQQRVVSATFDEDQARWTVRTQTGEEHVARWLLCATGSLSAINRPNIPGLDDFEGDLLLTSMWPKDGYDVTGKRVGIIGTGSSGVQSVPMLADDAARLTVFQRSANYSVPAFNRPLTPEEQSEARRTYPERRAASFASGGGSPYLAWPREFADIDEAERHAAFEDRWTKGGVLFGKTFSNQYVEPEVNDAATAFAIAKIRAVIDDPEVAEDLIPKDHPIGTKRICTDSGYFETFNRDNVELVNLRRDPIEAITRWGIKTAKGAYELDVLVLATGFDAMTGAMTRMDIHGPRGDVMAKTWANGPLTHLGLQVPGYPNLFTLNGPGSASVLANMVLTAEHQVDWVYDLIEHCAEEGFRTVEAREDAARAWTEHIDKTAQGTLFYQADSWYLGANIEGKKRMFMPFVGGFSTYIERCAEATSLGYAGFVFGA